MIQKNASVAAIVNVIGMKNHYLEWECCSVIFKIMVWQIMFGKAALTKYSVSVVVIFNQPLINLPNPIRFANRFKKFLKKSDLQNSQAKEIRSIW